MAIFSEESVVPLPIQDVLPIILTPENLAACMPAGEYARTEEENSWRGVASLAHPLGVAKFHCEFTIAPEDAESATIQLRAAYEGGATTAAVAANVRATPTSGVIRDNGGVEGAPVAERQVEATTLTTVGQAEFDGVVEGLDDGPKQIKVLFEALVDNVAAMALQPEADEASAEEEPAPLSPREQARLAAGEFIPEGPMETRQKAAQAGAGSPMKQIIALFAAFFRNLFRTKK